MQLVSKPPEYARQTFSFAMIKSVRLIVCGCWWQGLDFTIVMRRRLSLNGLATMFPKILSAASEITFLDLDLILASGQSFGPSGNNGARPIGCYLNDALTPSLHSHSSVNLTFPYDQKSNVIHHQAQPS